MNTNSFQRRHIGPSEKEQNEMLEAIGVESLEQLIQETIPEDIRLKKMIELDAPQSEYDYLSHIEEISKKIRYLRVTLDLDTTKQFYLALLKEISLKIQDGIPLTHHIKLRLLRKARGLVKLSDHDL